MKFKVAVVQFEINQLFPEKNLKKAENFIKKASERADVIIFPEVFIAGTFLKGKGAVDSNQKYCKHFQKLAQKYKIDIIAGSFIEKHKNKLFNTTYYIDAKGTIKGEYRKIHLWHPEKRSITAGNKISVFNTKLGKVGLIICWDLIFSEIFRKMVKKGVEIIFCPSFWCLQDAGAGLKYDKKAEIKNVNSLCESAAFENEIILVYCNAAGKVKSGKDYDDLIGRSQITVPFKGVLKRLNHNKEQMFIQEINTKIQADAERVYKIRKDLKIKK